ncbi:murein tripeptide amidase MpaA [Vibrio tritonius]|uniref:murein tripeptide amidase MpaA n=1 Tax=Vibrio tritonius TaxID=1435069 RepID=UPI00315D0819
MRQLIHRTERGFFNDMPTQYGQSAFGAPLLYFSAGKVTESTGLILAGTHGDETASIALLSAALRSLPKKELRHHVILSVNPDGNQLGTRSNGRGVDLNRSFPTQNWSDAGTVYRWNQHANERDVKLLTGETGKLEPETRALIELIDELNPNFVVSFHEPLACVDSADHSPLGQQLSAWFSLPLVDNVGYSTPGSFGTWCDERQLLNVTMELPLISVDEVTERYLDATLKLLTME